MIDSPVLGLETGALALGYRRPAEIDDQGLLRVKVLYEKHRRNFRLFWRRLPVLLRAFRTGRVAVAVARPSDADWLSLHGLHVRFLPGREGGLLWSVFAGIPTDAGHPEAAYAYLRAVLAHDGTGGRAAAAVVGPRDHAAWFVAWDEVKRAPPGGG